MGTGHDFTFQNCNSRAQAGIIANYATLFVQKNLKSKIGCFCEFEVLRFEVECFEEIAKVKAICRKCGAFVTIDHPID